MKEPKCSSCMHREVCALTDEFRALEEAVNAVSVRVGTGKPVSVRDLNWVKDLDIGCIYYWPELKVEL